MLRHRPTGVVVKCQAERSRALNRLLARRLLLDKLASYASSSRIPLLPTSRRCCPGEIPYPTH
ncbi:MAG TPA: hypothetical protein VKW76_01100 [Candidatus Binatia bacterium]|nr:hypothetical protein [Candidatus Binatia bacterium]